jgi:hypothetical protein
VPIRCRSKAETEAEVLLAGTAEIHFFFAVALTCFLLADTVAATLGVGSFGMIFGAGC